LTATVVRYLIPAFRALRDETRTMNDKRSTPDGFRARVHEIIFEADTPAGRAFDVALIVCILASVVVVMLESVERYDERYGDLFDAIEWTFTVLFTVEYLLRLYCVGSPRRYARSFFGVVDLLSILPTYLGAVFPTADAHTFLVIRVLRLLRLFRILKLVRYVSEARVLARALKASIPKIIVFLFAVFAVIIIVGALMHVVEGPTNDGFDSIPKSLYWAVVTMTTVGYGDVTPESALGKTISMFLMILGYGIIAVPTGIVSVELSTAARFSVKTTACPNCSHSEHDDDAQFCKRCGTAL